MWTLADKHSASGGHGLTVRHVHDQPGGVGHAPRDDPHPVTGVRGGPEPEGVTLEAFGREIPEA